GKNQQQIRYYQGSISSTPLVQDKVNFVSGWNEFTFSKPLVIGDEDIYVGFQVFETNGSPYPAGCYRPVSVPDANFISLDRKGFQAYTNRGSLYIEAIIETDGPVAPAAIAMATDYPLVVAPSTPFEAGIYLRNLSSEPIRTATVSVCNEAGEVSDNIKFEFDEPIAAFDGRMIPGREVILGSETGSDVPATCTVSEINGKATTVTHPVDQRFYVSVDAFTRVPLVEEYTSMYCINCPIMFYFLEKAIHAFEHQIVYLTRHSGFMDDDFTTPMDKALEKHFGVVSNPTVMYDRTILPGENRIMHGASNDLKYTGYTDCLDKARHIPALASVNVTVDEEAGTVTVSGRASVGTQTTDGRLHISAYLVEDNIPTALFPQRGIDYDSDVYAEDPLTPADFLSSYRHNGVVRASLTAGEMGDKLTLDDEEGHYSVTYPIPAIKDGWVAENLHYVAFLHRNTPGTD
ncbi:MAG: Omp28-related outer membrane protein, partial [Muribaculaceae bacterium]|nr:Omp28-related outer membrane protein [Muribaculaceae bacterium]